jgi:outer membrane beta-barrel protein
MKTLTLLLIATLGFASRGVAQPPSPQRQPAQEQPAGALGAPSDAPTDVDQLESIFRDEQHDDAMPMTSGERVNVPTESMNQVRQLEPFKDIAVIQRRFLPKTHRFELFGSGGLIVNDAFFDDFTFGLRFAYHLTESYGIELMGNSISTTQKEVTNELQTNKSVTTQTFVSPSSYYGLDFRWTPWYGKMSWLNKSIVPFDHFFLLGVGTTGTNQSTNAPSFHIGTGQLYALSKSFAFRWNFDWMFYNTTSSVSGATGNANYNNLYLMVGLSWFFPEAKYR